MEEALAKTFETLDQLEQAPEPSQEFSATQLAVLRFRTFEIYRHLDTELKEQREREAKLAALAEEEARLKQAIQSGTKQTKDYETQAVLANGQKGLLAQYQVAAPEEGVEQSIETVILNEASARRKLFCQNAELKLHASQLRTQRDDLTKFLYDSTRLNTWFNELIGFARKIQREYQHTYDVMVEGIDEPDPIVPRRSGRGDRSQRRRDETRESERDRRRKRDEERRDARRADLRNDERAIARGSRRSAEEPRRGDARRDDRRDDRRDERQSEIHSERREDRRVFEERRNEKRDERRDERRDDRFDSRRQAGQPTSHQGSGVHREDDRQRGSRSRRDRKRRRRD